MLRVIFMPRNTQKWNRQIICLSELSQDATLPTLLGMSENESDRDKICFRT